MDRQQMEAAVARIYETRLKNDPAAFAPLLAPHAAYNMMGEGAPPRVEGAALGPFLDELIRSWRFEAVDLRSLSIDGNKAAAHVRIKATFMPTGDGLDTEALDLFTFDDSGLLVECLEFVDTATVSACMAKVA